jgi:ABC-type multidrug transport system ATPase subunit
MARRLRNSFTTRYRSGGRILLNGAVPSDAVIRSLCSYVTQDDDGLLPFLTVRETLHFAAALRLPSHMSSADKERRAEEVILKMGLKDCADISIGCEFIKGISGGQKRRVTIAVQVLTEPRILLLDEPTSGLDAFTAASILTVLHGLASEGRTVICTIHQSRSELFDKFGNVLLLARGGHAMYSGPASEMLPYFSSLGHECPSKTNPTDFALDLVTVDLQHADREKESRSKIQDLISAFSHSDALALRANDQQRTVSLPAELGAMKRQMSPFWRAYPVLLRRSLLNIKRQPPIIAARIMQVMGLGIILGLFFAPLGHGYAAVQNRLGYIQQFTALLFVGMLQNLTIYPTERDVFYKEHEDRAYSPTSFFCAYTTHEVPFEILASLLFALIGDLAVGLPRTPQLFFAIVANVFFIVNCGESIGIVFNTFFSHTGFAVNITSTVIALAVAMSGIISTHMPLVLERINYISPLRYAIRNMVPYSLHGVVFTCTDRERLPSGQCPITTGDQAMELYGLGGVVAWKNLVGLAAATLVYRIVAYVVLVGKRGRFFG